MPDKKEALCDIKREGEHGSIRKRAKEGEEKRKKGEKKSDENLGNSHFPASDEALFARGGVVASGYSSRGGRKYEGIPPR